MEYNSVLAPIPQNFKRLLHNRSNLPHQVSFSELVMTKPNPSRYLSQISRNQLSDHDGCQEAWQNDLNETIDDRTWNNVLTDVYLLTNLEYLRWFQYRLIHCLIVTNVHHNKFDLNCSILCTFCQNAPETVLHLFMECHLVQIFWHNLEKWIKYIFKISVTFNKTTIILNNYNGQGRNMVNMFVLVAKQYIYATKCNQTNLKFIGFSKKLVQTHSIEKSVAIRQDKLKKHEHKWYLFHNI